MLLFHLRSQAKDDSVTPTHTPVKPVYAANIGNIETPSAVIISTFEDEEEAKKSLAWEKEERLALQRQIDVLTHEGPCVERTAKIVPPGIITEL